MTSVGNRVFSRVSVCLGSLPALLRLVSTPRAPNPHHPAAHPPAGPLEDSSVLVGGGVKIWGLMAE